MDFTIKKCKSKATYSTKPKKNIKLDLSRIKQRLGKVIIDTPITLVMDVEGEEIIVQKYGEIMFKKCEDKEKIRKISERIYKIGIK